MHANRRNESGCSSATHWSFTAKNKYWIIHRGNSLMIKYTLFTHKSDRNRIWFGKISNRLKKINKKKHNLVGCFMFTRLKSANGKEWCSAVKPQIIKSDLLWPLTGAWERLRWREAAAGQKTWVCIPTWESPRTGPRAAGPHHWSSQDPATQRATQTLARDVEK